MKFLTIFTFLFLFFTGCSVKHDIHQSIYDGEMKKLSYLIKSISKNIDKKEAQSVAYEAIIYSKKLSNKYNLISPPLLHNSLVNLGLKDKGFCYHFANDLMTYLKNKNYKSFEFMKVVSKRGEYFEHNSFILIRDDVKFEDSIVFDAWRNSGVLYFSKVKDDKNYDWEVR